MEHKIERETLIKAIRDIYEEGLVYGKSGNLSVRTKDNNVLIKPSGCSYAELTEKDLVLVDINGKKISGKFAPSSETPMHVMIYAHFENVKAVVHTHSENSLVCAITGTEIPIFCNEGIDFGGTIPVSGYAIPGSIAIGKQAVKALMGPPQVTGVILRNHGAITIGGSMPEACKRAIMLEKLASIYCRALSVGPVTNFSEEKVQDIIDHYVSLKKKNM